MAGINVITSFLPSSYTDFIDHILPELTRRGLAQTSYAPGTLREKFGESQPYSANPTATFYRTH